MLPMTKNFQTFDYNFDGIIFIATGKSVAKAKETAKIEFDA